MSNIKCGYSKVCITPKLGTLVSGYYEKREAKEILDDLYVFAAAFDDGEKKAVVIAADIIMFPKTTCDEYRKVIADYCGIEFASILISCSHTHTAPMIGSDFASDLHGKEVSEKGLRGCFDYWSKSLNEEACDFKMELDEDRGEFTIDMRWCPSKGMLNSIEHMEPYHDYCGHCAILYARQLKKYGILSDEFDMSKVDEAKCFERYVLADKKK